MAKPTQECDNLLNDIQPVIDSNLNEDLMCKFTEDEVLEAIKLMASLKASSNDGFPAIFYQKLWHIVGRKVTKFCLDVLNNKKRIDGINVTNIDVAKDCYTQKHWSIQTYQFVQCSL